MASKKTTEAAAASAKAAKASTKDKVTPVKVKVFKRGGQPLPIKMSKGAACVDLHAEVGNDFLLLNGKTERIPTGLFVEIPEGYCFKIYPRSGIAHKEGLTLSNCVGVIDADFRGQIHVSLTNSSNTGRWIRNGQRIAQMMLEKVIEWEWEEVENLEDLEESERGVGGFGSSGKEAVN